MDLSNLAKTVRRITVLRTALDGSMTPVTLYERSRERKKGSRLLRPAERAARQLVDAQSRAASDYLDRHARSNRKRKDGWLRDWGLNLVKASRKGSKAIKVNRLFSA